MSLGPGTTLGPYRIVAALGAGGMGEVWRARDTRLERDVAVKVLTESLADNAEALARFQREARAVAALSHPNILTVYDIGTDQGVCYVVTELLEGETLRARLAAGGLDWKKAVEIGAALADGLAAAHAKGIVHRDLKPDNIFLTSDGRVKILDFGLARFVAPDPETATATLHLGAGTQAGTVLGTMGYMSPEQVRGETAGPASDIFSLGCVLYEMLARRRAFERASGAETMSAILRDAPPELARADRPPLPPELARLVARCLEKVAEQRFQSARDLAFALRATATDSHPAHHAPAEAATGAIDSIAVLPFVNASRDPDTEYLSDGITESIINNLAQLPKLRVIPRSTMFRFKGRDDADPQTVGRELNVRSVLAGRVLQRGETLVVSAELVDVAAQTQLWGERYNRKLADIFAVEEEISRQISEKLRVRLSGEEQKLLARRATGKTEAYQLYLKGRYHWYRRSADGFQKAIDYFRRAIEIDPAYALPYSGLADSYCYLSIYTLASPGKMIAQAREAAAKALELDPGLAEAHFSRALVLWGFDWEWKAAEEAFRHTLELNPSYTMGGFLYSFYLFTMGRPDEAVTVCLKALEIDPLSLLGNTYLGMVLCWGDRLEEADEQFRKTLEMDPDYPMALGFGSIVPLLLGRCEEAVRMLERSAPNYPIAVPWLGHAYAVAGRHQDARRMLEQVRDSYFRCMILNALGETEQALDALEAAFEERSFWVTWLNSDPRMRSLRPHPRFEAVLRRLGLAG